MSDEAIREAPARRRLSLGGAAGQIGLFAIVVGFWLFFSWREPGFLSTFNLFNLGRSHAVDQVIGV